LTDKIRIFHNLIRKESEVRERVLQAAGKMFSKPSQGKPKEKEKKEGIYRNNLDDAFLTDPATKARNDMGFPMNNPAATGVMRKHFIEKIQGLKTGPNQAEIVEIMRAARSTFSIGVMEIAKNYQFADHVLLSIIANTYSTEKFFDKIEDALVATNVKVQKAYTPEESNESDLKPISTNAAKEKDLQSITAVLTCLTEAVCQITERNKNKSPFIHSDGYQGTKKNNTVEALANLKHAWKELITTNSVSHYYRKMAAIEKHELPTLLRILHLTVCPTFGPKDYQPVDASDVEPKRTSFEEATDQYYVDCIENCVNTMQDARAEKENELDALDDSLSTIFDGDYAAYELSKEETKNKSRGIEEANDNYSEQMRRFQSFVSKSLLNFLLRGNQYFDSQSKFFTKVGGLNSNYAMAGYGMIMVIILAEAGIFLGAGWKAEILAEYDKVYSEYKHLLLPDLQVTELTDEQAQESGNFKESKLVNSMNKDHLEGIEPVIDAERFRVLYQGLLDNQDGKSPHDLSGFGLDHHCIMTTTEKYEGEFDKESSRYGKKKKDPESPEEERKKRMQNPPIPLDPAASFMDKLEFYVNEVTKVLDIDRGNARQGVYWTFRIFEEAKKMKGTNPEKELTDYLDGCSKYQYNSFSLLVMALIDWYLKEDEATKSLVSSTMGSYARAEEKEEKLTGTFMALANQLSSLMWEDMETTGPLEEDDIVFINNSQHSVKSCLYAHQKEGSKLNTYIVADMVVMSYRELFSVDLGGRARLVRNVKNINVSITSGTLEKIFTKQPGTNSAVTSKVDVLMKGTYKVFRTASTSDKLSKNTEAKKNIVKNMFKVTAPFEEGVPVPEPVRTLMKENSLIMVPYTNTKNNCAFHSAKICFDLSEDPSELREVVSKLAQESALYDDMFLKNGEASTDV
jgi:hypothetical protein